MPSRLRSNSSSTNATSSTSTRRALSSRRYSCRASSATTGTRWSTPRRLRLRGRPEAGGTAGAALLGLSPDLSLREDRDWLTVGEAAELRALLDAYWANFERLPPQVKREISLSEAVVHQPTLERALVIMFMGLEALLNTGKHQVTKQISERMVMLANEIGFARVSRGFGEEMYGDRSSLAHGQELELPPAVSAEQEQESRWRTTDLPEERAMSGSPTRSSCSALLPASTVPRRGCRSRRSVWSLSGSMSTRWRGWRRDAHRKLSQ
jgi:hypothetical protein